MERKESKYKISSKGFSNKSAISDEEHKILLEMNQQKKTAK